MPPAAFLKTSHDPWFVAASLLVAAFAAYVALDLAQRVRRDGRPNPLWWFGGSLAMGTGVWSMHFVGMLGFDAEGLVLGYRWLPTLFSWLAAVVAAAVALGIAARAQLDRRLLLLGSTCMAAAICTMHYLGMHAIELAPPIIWNVPMVLASIGVAWVASAAALGLFFGLREQRGRRRYALQVGSAALMAGAIGGMHYMGMAAAQLPVGTVCLSANSLSGAPLALMVTVATVFILGGAMLLLMLDAMAYNRESQLTQSLHQANHDLRRANDRLQRKAFEDPLTGLPNRALFDDRLQHAVTRVARTLRNQNQAVSAKSRERVAVLFFDLDGFKPINDSFGHEVGDKVLRSVALRLQQSVRESDTLARLGGDEFVVMVEAADAQAVAMGVAQRLIESLRRPLIVDGKEMSLSCSIGMAVFPDHDDAGQRLLACADAAMYTAKRAGGGTCVVYDQSMAGDSTEQLMLREALRHALEHGELQLHYQPKITAQSGEVHGFEALLRWHHPERGLISPSTFVPLAERFGLIGSIGAWVIEEACAQLARWHADGLQCRVAINLSPYQLRNPSLTGQIRDALTRHGIEPSQLVCEITESALIETMNTEGATLAELAALGVRLAIDDFGTGYSSLAHLKHIPAGQLKIDRSFVTGLAGDADARAMVDAIVRLAHALRMEVVAEGVETADQQRLLSELGCDVLQGFVFAKPMPAADVAEWLKAKNSSAPPFAPTA